MKKITLGTPENVTPKSFCDTFNYTETKINFPVDKITATNTPRGYLIEFPLEDDAAVFGGGLQLKQFNHRGTKLRLAVNADPRSPMGDGHAPVPFFVTNKGYGIYIDTLRNIEVYCGFRKRLEERIPDPNDKGRVSLSTEDLYAYRFANNTTFSILIPGAQGADIYIIEGKTITDIVAQYNMLSGGGPNVPEWGLGVLYRCCTRWTQDRVLEIAKYFKESDIPLDILGLEPGWQTNTYSCSYIWSDRFPNPATMIKELKSQNIHINLWEHAFTHPSSPIYHDLFPYSGEYEVWGGIVPDFATKEARDIFASHQRKALIDLGVDGFKLDECDSSDHTGSWSFPLTAKFPSGLDGEQYHSIFGELYVKTLLQALNGTPTFSLSRNMGALAAPYPFVLYSDLYDHADFIRGVVNSGFSGLLWAPEVRDAKDKDDMLRRLQAVVFSVQCLINAWYCDDVPWKDLDCENEVRDLLKLRKSLVPMLKAAFDKYHKTGIPPIRALASDYTDDPETYKIEDEYLFCDNLLVAPIISGTGNTRTIYLPQGNWVDFFTKSPVTPGYFQVTTPNIPVYEKR